jgi:hypothetical protein
MDNLPLELIITLDTESEITEDALYQLTTQVLRDIAKVGVNSVKRIQNAQTPLGAKGFPIDINTLVVSLGTAGVLTAIVDLLKDWVLRAEGRKVKLKTEINGKSIELEYSPTATSQKELIAFAEKLIQILDRQTIERP